MQNEQSSLMNIFCRDFFRVFFSFRQNNYSTSSALKSPARQVRCSLLSIHEHDLRRIPMEYWTRPRISTISAPRRCVRFNLCAGGSKRGIGDLALSPGGPLNVSRPGPQSPAWEIHCGLFYTLSHTSFQLEQKIIYFIHSVSVIDDLFFMFFISQIFIQIEVFIGSYLLCEVCLLTREI